jgi:hypothetical protein
LKVSKNHSLISFPKSKTTSSFVHLKVLPMYYAL